MKENRYNQIPILVSQISRILVDAISESIKSENISYQELEILEYLWEHGSITQKKLNAEMIIKRYQASRLLDELEVKGLVTRSKEKKEFQSLF